MSEPLAITLNALLCIGAIVALFVVCRVPFRFSLGSVAQDDGPGREPGRSAGDGPALALLRAYA